MAVLFAAACGTPQPTPSQPVLCGELHADQVFHGTLAESAIDRYSVDLEAGDSLLLDATQNDVDLVIRVAGPGIHQPLLFDSPPATMAPERVCTVAQRTGVYAVDLSPYTGAGAYSLHVLHLRPATEPDRLCAEAAAVFASARSTESRATRLEHAERAGRLWQAAGEVMLATVAWRQVGQLRLDRGESGQGIAGLERALSLARKSTHTRLETSVLNRLGLAYRDGGDLPRAAVALDRALALSRDGSDVRGLAAALTNRGLLDEEMGEPHRAVDRYRQALELWRGQKDSSETAQALVNLATVLGILDHHDEAFDALDEALDLARGAEDTDREATVQAAIGWTHYLRAEPHLGLAPLREALTLRRARRDTKGEAGVLDRLGTVLLAAGDRVEAERAYRASLRISQPMDLPGYRAATENNLGCLLAETKRSQEAMEFLANTLDYFQGSGDLKSWSHAEYCLARLALRRGEIDGALEHVREALAIVERLRERARAAGHHYQPIWLWQDYAELEVALLLDRHRAGGDPRDLAEAFAAADRMRARTLHELVVLSRGGAERAAGRVLKARAESLQARLSSLGAERNALLAAGSSPNPTTKVDDEIRGLRLALQFVRAEMRVAARDAGWLGMPQAVSAAEAQRLLDPRTVLLTYVLGPERSHLFALTHDGLKAFDLEPQGVLEKYAETLYHGLEGSRNSGGQWRFAASALGRLLLPPEAIPQHVDRLMLAPEGMLHYVPFAVLASPHAASAEGPAERLVLDDFEVLTIPSAAVLAALRMRRQGRVPAARAVAVFADPVFSVDDPRVEKARAAGPAPGRAEVAGGQPGTGRLSRGIVAARLPAGPLPRLPATADEAAAILSRVPPDLCLARLGPEATKQAVLSADLRSYRILHFATHAWIDERFPELSGLVLSTIDNTGREIDGALYLHEIDRLDLVADLTVLSGCQTALGRKVRGNGLVGLTQGFFHAGSSQVLVSLWSLDDTAAAQLMGELYSRMLDGGDTPAAALRHAQQWLRKQDDFQAPRFWAPFGLQGDG